MFKTFSHYLQKNLKHFCGFACRVRVAWQFDECVPWLTLIPGQTSNRALNRV